MLNTASKSLLEDNCYDYLLAIAFNLQKDLIDSKNRLEKNLSEIQKIEYFLTDLGTIVTPKDAFEFLNKIKDIPYNHCIIKGPHGEALNNPLER